ncbi:MAG: hypothetical protein IJU23_04965 [Proteobacteria bacterium]|nr:hypothetical protein [Pseudomonadota bacterium]
MKKYPMTLILMAVLGWMGCDETEVLYLQPNPDGKTPIEHECNDTCNGSPECVNDHSYRICQVDNTGCKSWSAPQNCATGKICLDGACIDQTVGCTDSCDGDAKCVDDHSFHTCQIDNDGCRHWSEPTECNTDMICQDCSCVPKPCTDACPKEGDTRCNDKTVESCRDDDHNGCLEWVKSSECQYACADGKCSQFPECTTPVCPKPVTEFNTWLSGDTSKSQNIFGQYPSCHDVGTTDTQDESGPEDYYILNLEEPGVLVVSLKQSKGVDVDVHILDSLEANKCLARGDISAGSYLNAGLHYVSVDTFGGPDKAGQYEIIFYFLPDSGKCGMVQKTMPRHNDDIPLQMPVTGPVGRESHLVTTYDQTAHGGSSWWPSDAWDADSLAIHKKKTKELFGDYISYTSSEGDNKWCSVNSKGQAGHPSCAHALPPKAEAWDVNMYWLNRPAEGTFYLVFNPANGKAVIAAAGYETGPGAKTQMGGAVPEIHNYFGTQHKSIMLFGELKNQNLTEDDYGPIDCFK